MTGKGLYVRFFWNGEFYRVSAHHCSHNAKLGVIKLPNGQYVSVLRKKHQEPQVTSIPKPKEKKCQIFNAEHVITPTKYLRKTK